MRVEVAKTAGFCPGVKRAVDMVEAAAMSGVPTVTYGPIIHNRHVVERFAAMGVHQVEHYDEVQPGTQVVIRSHGVSRAVYEGLNSRGAVIQDATCPYVKRIHQIVSKGSEQGRCPIIIGIPTHPEVEAHRGAGAAAKAADYGFSDHQHRKVMEKLRGNYKKAMYKLRNL